MRGRSVSNATVSNGVVPFASALVKSTGDGWSFASLRASGSVPGQSGRYDCPSKSPSSEKHPLIFTSVESAAGTQKSLSSSSSSAPLSWSPGLTQFVFVASSLRQFSKCPISSDIATLYVCADQVLPRGFAVEYSGWNAYGSMLQVAESGWYRMWPKPFATDAVIEPLVPVVRSSRSVRTPSGVSWMWIRTRSPGFIMRSWAGSGLSAVKSGFSRVPLASGFAGPWDTPLRVTYAQLIGSGPPRTKSSQAALFSVFVFWSCVRLSIVIAAQYCVAVQPKPSNCGTYPGP